MYYENNTVHYFEVKALHIVETFSSGEHIE